MADALRRRLHGTTVTYARVALCPFDASVVDAVPVAAREVRITGQPPSFDIAVSVPLVLEYEGVLLRHLTSSQRKADVLALVDYLCSVAHQQPIFFLWRPLLRDANDDMVAEVAVASSASAIVTHNVRDFDAVTRFAVRVLAPAQFLLQLSRR
jgi:predicted nucleic acid-binding protein